MKKTFLFFLLALTLLASCRDDDTVISPEKHNTGESATSEVLGLYVLCEGNMGSNKATLDYLDLTSGIYNRNIYPSRNPSQVKELGDVGNDVKIYGDKLWMVINQSNKVEVANAYTAISQGHVDIPNCRYLAFSGRYAYVSSYQGPISGKSVLGQVYKVDTASLSVVATCTVGYQPEEMAIVGNKLYVANSGGYSAMQGEGYDRTVSVIDLQTFKEERKIDVAINLFRLRADHYGNLWVSSRGNYGKIASKLFLLSNKNGSMQLTDSIDVPVGDMSFRGDSLIYYGTKGAKANYGIIDIRTHSIVNSNPIHIPDTDPVRTPYGLMVHPQTGDIYLMDATNYVSSGKLYCFDGNGNYKWSTWTGDIPGHGAFLIKQTKK